MNFLLFYKMDWCERHPKITLLIVAGLILLEAVFEGVMQRTSTLKPAQPGTS